ncbi:MAG: M23 family metallopeptidase [Syntrophales bacterium]|jgi:murein DD-endopeptidase MepM/ murein hydrolase activator NlpD|nr:M23 family metallopeptidase [Syntrophales bacterium]
MPRNIYTLLILPKKDKAAKKISMSGTLVWGVSISIMVLVLFMSYLSYDYIHIRREQAELNRLKQQTAEQRRQIDGLVSKVDRFAVKMDELRQVDQKIRIMAKLVVGKNKDQLLGIGGPVSEENRLRSKVVADDQAMISEIGRRVEHLMDDAALRERSFTDLLVFLQRKKSLLAATPSVWPVLGWVTSEFGKRLSPFGSEPEFHKGIDIATRAGTPVHAPADGIVAEVAYRHDLGQMVRIDHGHGISTLFGHLSRAIVRNGTTVRKGDRIGLVGNTGRSTGSHLHYTVNMNGVAVNPRKYLN